MTKVVEEGTADIQARYDQLQTTESVNERIDLIKPNTGCSCCFKHPTNNFYNQHFLRGLSMEKLNLPATIKDERLLGQFKGQDINAILGCCAKFCCYTNFANTKTVGILVTTQRMVIIDDNLVEIGSSCCNLSDIYRSAGVNETRTILWQDVESIKRYSARAREMRGICFGCCRSWASNESVRVIIKLRRPKNLINDLCGALPAVPVPGFPDPYTINLSVRASESDDLLNAVYEGHRHYSYRPPMFNMPLNDNLPKPLSELPVSGSAPFLLYMSRHK